MIGFFDRIIYYGLRAIIVLYAIDVFGMDRVDVLSSYGLLTTLIVVLPLPFGWLTDVVLGQKKAIVVGSLLSLAGCLCLFIPQWSTTMMGMLLVVLGSSFVSPNVKVLVGRLFDKKDQGRVLGFTMLFVFINLGSFLAVMSIGFVGEVYGWQWGFGIAALSSLLMLLFFLATQNRLDLAEVAVQESAYEEGDHETDILDVPPTQSHPPVSSSLPVVLLVTGISIFFYTFYGAVTDVQMTGFSMYENVHLFGSQLSYSALANIAWSASPIAMLLFLLIWSFTKVGSSIAKFGWALLLLGAVAIGTLLLPSFSEQTILLYTFLGLFLIGMAETFISPVLTSYITRISSVQYASTYYGLFLLLSFLAPKLLSLATGFLIQQCLSHGWDSSLCRCCSVVLEKAHLSTGQRH
ncbi:MAG: MFS transporter [Bacteroidota bacterium]